MKLIPKLLATAIATLFATSAFAADKDHVQKWKEDIDFYYEMMSTKHINPYHSVSKERFKKEIDDLSAKVASLSEPQIIFELMRITRLINDGHTQFPIWAGSHRRYPFRFRLFGDNVRVTATSKEYQPYLGARLVAIDGIPVVDILDTLKSAVQGVENDYSLKSSLAVHLMIDNMLYAICCRDNQELWDRDIFL